MNEKDIEKKLQDLPEVDLPKDFHMKMMNRLREEEQTNTQISLDIWSIFRPKTLGVVLGLVFVVIIVYGVLPQSYQTSMLGETNMMESQDLVLSQQTLSAGMSNIASDVPLTEPNSQGSNESQKVYEGIPNANQKTKKSINTTPAIVPSPKVDTNRVDTKGELENQQPVESSDTSGGISEKQIDDAESSVGVAPKERGTKNEETEMNIVEKMGPEQDVQKTVLGAIILDQAKGEKIDIRIEVVDFKAAVTEIQNIVPTQVKDDKVTIKIMQEKYNDLKEKLSMIGKVTYLTKPMIDEASSEMTITVQLVLTKN